MTFLQTPRPADYRQPYVNDSVEDKTEPIILMQSSIANKPSVQDVSEQYNNFQMNERASHGRRTRIRIDFEVYARQKRGDLGFTRLRGKGLLLSCPSPEQAQLVIDTVTAIVKSMEGKVLCR